MTLLAEVDKLLSFLEAEIPGNINTPKNQKLERSLERDLAKYFRRLEQAFPYSKLAGIYNRNVKESLASDANGAIDPVLSTLKGSLDVILNGHAVRAYLSASAEMISWGQTKAGIPITFEGPPIQDAIAYAKKHTATLVKGINEETKRRLAQVISEGIEGKRGIPGLTRDIKKEFSDMSTMRAKMIARTETNDALSQAFMDRSKEMGVKSKSWITFEPCVICEGNGSEGVVPLNHVFGSGHDAPPAHPNCNCALAPSTRASK